MPAHKNHVLVLDVGTTGLKALVFDTDLNVIAKHGFTLKKSHPLRGWVEQDPQEYLRKSKLALKGALRKSGLEAKDIASVGITNQRETTILWDTKTGRAVYPAIVWQDTRTRRLSRTIQKEHGSLIQHKTGLVADSYFSATKIHWMLEHIPKAGELLQKNRLAFGTIDSWLIWHLCKNHPHVTDVTNASRTLLLNIKTLHWDDELLEVFGVPKEMLPTVLPSRAAFGTLQPEMIGASLPVHAVAGDQQASLYAAGSKKGMTKTTFGTGTFVNQHLGATFQIHPPFFTTLAVSTTEKPRYALEAKIDRGGRELEPLLSSPTRTLRFLNRLASDTYTLLSQLPTIPKRITVDGGVSRDGIVAEALEAQSGISITSHPTTFDGTALGIAKLLLEK